MEEKVSRRNKYSGNQVLDMPHQISITLERSITEDIDEICGARGGVSRASVIRMILDNHIESYKTHRGSE